MLFVATHQLRPIGERIHLRFTLPSSKEPIEAPQARVARRGQGIRIMAPGKSDGFRWKSAAGRL